MENPERRTYCSNGHWGPVETEKYLISIAKDPRSLIPISQYPEKIEFGKEWHDLLNLMRKESRDGNERGALFGNMGNDSNFYLPRETVRGSKGSVPLCTILDELGLYGRIDTSGIIGMAHSHPNDLLTRLFYKISATVRFYSLREEHISPTDLFILLEPEGVTKTMLLAERNRNFLAICSAETKIEEMDEDTFFEHWYYENNSLKKRFPSLFDLSNAIAANHELALYEGKPNRVFERIVPS